MSGWCEGRDIQCFHKSVTLTTSRSHQVWSNSSQSRGLVAENRLKLWITICKVSLIMKLGRLFSLSNDLQEDTLTPASVKLTVEDLLPWAKVKFTICYGHDYLPTHDLLFHVRIGIVFAHVIMAILVDRFVRCKLL
jgi:hypothetical protein